MKLMNYKVTDIFGCFHSDKIFLREIEELFLNALDGVYFEKRFFFQIYYTSSLTNQKGGAGKTNTAVNLGVSMVKQGKKVLPIDPYAQANLTIALGDSRPDDIPATL